MPFLTHRDAVARWAFVFAYLLLAVAGSTIPLQMLAFREVGRIPVEWVWWLMSGSLGFGGLVCAVGAICRRWVGEFAGLPFVFSSLFALGLLQANISEWSPLAVPSVSLLWALGGFAVTRWRQTVYYYHISQMVERTGSR